MHFHCISARQNTWLGKRPRSAIGRRFIGLIGIQGRKLQIMKSRRTIIEFVQRSTEPKSVSVNKRSISCCLNTFLAFWKRERERERRGRLTMKWQRKDRLQGKLPITLIASPSVWKLVSVWQYSPANFCVHRALM